MSALSPNFSTRPCSRKSIFLHKLWNLVIIQVLTLYLPVKKPAWRRKLAAWRATEKTSCLHQIIESCREQGALLKVLWDLEVQVVTLTSGFNSKTETQKKPESKPLQKSPVLALPLSLCSGALFPHEAPEEESSGDNEGEEEGEIGDQSPSTPPHTPQILRPWLRAGMVINEITPISPLTLRV